jgi:hypothetical protein
MSSCRTHPVAFADENVVYAPEESFISKSQLNSENGPGSGLELLFRFCVERYFVFGDFWFSNEISFWAAGGTATAPLKIMLSASTFFP